MKTPKSSCRICWQIPLLFTLLFFGTTAGMIAGDGQENQRKAIDDAIAKVKPALVQIHVVAQNFYDGREQKFEAFGSGVIVSPDGLVVTNHHVAGHTARIFCILSDKRKIPAELVGTDPLSDISVLRLPTENKEQFPFVSFGDSDKLEVGDTVLAMGSPVSISQSVTQGIVSNIAMTMPLMYKKYGIKLRMDGEDVGSLVRWIGHDAVIYPGNSGGPLVNLKGEVVGINEIGIGLGGAIPSNIAKEVYDSIVKDGKMERAWIGLEFQPLLKSQADNKGVLVSGTIEDSPAEKAGFLPGDIMIRLDGKDVNVKYDEELPILCHMVSELPIDKEAKALILRDGKEKEISLTPVHREPAQPKTSEIKPWGITARDISNIDAKELKRENQKGVLVTSVRTGGPSGESKPSLQEDDVIVEVGGKPVENMEAFTKLTKDLTPKGSGRNPVLAAFERKSNRFLTVIKLGSEEITDHGREVSKAWLPVGFQVMTREIAEKLGIKGKSGVIVTMIYPGSKSVTDGLQIGDIIMAVDGDKVQTVNPEDAEVFTNMIRQYDIGAKPELAIFRAGKELKVPVELIRTPYLPREMKKYSDEDFEIVAREIASMEKTENKLDEKESGVEIDEVKPGSWATLGNLNNGDIVSSINGIEVKNLADFENAMKKMNSEKPKTVVFKVLRGIHRLFIEVEPKWNP